MRSRRPPNSLLRNSHWLTPWYPSHVVADRLFAALILKIQSILAAEICYTNSCRSRFSGVYLVLEVFQDACRSNKENPSAHWNNYANSYLVPISFWSGSGCWPFLGFIGTYLILQACISFCSVSDKSGASMFLPCSRKNAVAHVCWMFVCDCLVPQFLCRFLHCIFWQFSRCFFLDAQSPPMWVSSVKNPTMNHIQTTAESHPNLLGFDQKLARLQNQVLQVSVAVGLGLVRKIQHKLFWCCWTVAGAFQGVVFSHLGIIFVCPLPSTKVTTNGPPNTNTQQKKQRMGFREVTWPKRPPPIINNKSKPGEKDLRGLGEVWWSSRQRLLQPPETETNPNHPSKSKCTNNTWQQIVSANGLQQTCCTNIDCARLCSFAWSEPHTHQSFDSRNVLAKYAISSCMMYSLYCLKGWNSRKGEYKLGCHKRGCHCTAPARRPLEQARTQKTTSIPLDG